MRVDKKGARISAMPRFSIAAGPEPRQPSRGPEDTRPRLILLPQPYLVHPTEHRHKLAEDSSADAGDVDKRALGEGRKAREGSGAGVQEAAFVAFRGLTFIAPGTVLGPGNRTASQTAVLLSRSFVSGRKGGDALAFYHSGKF